MKWVLLGLLVMHGAIHLMGLAAAFGSWQPSRRLVGIKRWQGLCWLAATLAIWVTALLVALDHPLWWAVGLAAGLLSQALIVSVWQEARFGTAVNVVLVLGTLYGFASHGPVSFGAELSRRLSRRPASSPRPLITERDLAGLPEPLRCYLRRAQVVGRPAARSFTARWRGRIRGGPKQPWMHFEAQQLNVVDPPARFFLMRASRGALPVEVFHTFTRGSARMQVKLFSLIPLVDLSGPELTRAETVTLFNDLCLLAPGTLLDPTIRWHPLGPRAVRGHYRLGENTVSAVLFFSRDCRLIDFVSDDRLMADPDGKTLVRRRWSTPVTAYRRFGRRWRFSSGKALWHLPGGTFSYFEAELLDLRVDDGR